MNAYLEPIHSATDRLADALMLVRADMAENCLWIGEYRRSLGMCDLKPEYRAFVEKRLAAMVSSYLANLRMAHGYEMRLAAE